MTKLLLHGDYRLYVNSITTQRMCPSVFTFVFPMCHIRETQRTLCPEDPVTILTGGIKLRILAGAGFEVVRRRRRV
ncbi:MAG: hypothetical protein HN368_16400 [Spirochaetales bacterium]|nr:hypothetical protein [Spirochaetales bacterium]